MQNGIASKRSSILSFQRISGVFQPILGRRMNFVMTTQIMLSIPGWIQGVFVSLANGSALYCYA